VQEDEEYTRQEKAFNRNLAANLVVKRNLKAARAVAFREITRAFFTSNSVVFEFLWE